MAKVLTWTKDGGAALKMASAVVKLNGQVHLRMHTAAQSGLFQMLVHRNSTPMLELLNGLNFSSVYVKGLADWCEKAAKVKVSYLKDDHKYKIIYPKDFKNLDDATASEKVENVIQFWKMNPPPKDFKGFKLSTAIKTLLTQIEEAERQIAEGTAKRGNEIIELTEKDIKTIDLAKVDLVKAGLQAYLN